MEEFINLKQGNTIIDKYSLKFTLLSKYASSLMYNPRDEMSRFVTGVFELMKEECRTTMLYNNMNLSRVTVYE